MDKGFLPVVPTSKSKQPLKKPPPISMQELQGSLSRDKGFLPVVVPTSKSKQPLKKPPPISMQELQGSLSSYFDDLRAPRVKRTKRHLLKDILVIAILSTIAEGEGWEDMENYGISKQQ